MIEPAEQDPSKGRRRFIPVAAPAAALLLCALLFAGLGIWQIQRLAWKEALIAHVEAATKAPPVTLVGPLGAPHGLVQPYGRIALSGHFLPETTTLVATASELGSGYWDMVVLQTDAVQSFWINRGFIPSGSHREAMAKATPTGHVDLIGLLRLSEPKGRFLRTNVPAEDRWYSRDLARFNQARGSLAREEYFVDMQSIKPAIAGQPVPGLTVLAFSNNHLQYALTWFALCGMSLLGIWLVLRQPD